MQIAGQQSGVARIQNESIRFLEPAPPLVRTLHQRACAGQQKGGAHEQESHGDKHGRAPGGADRSVAYVQSIVSQHHGHDDGHPPYGHEQDARVQVVSVQNLQEQKGRDTEIDGQSQNFGHESHAVFFFCRGRAAVKDCQQNRTEENVHEQKVGEEGENLKRNQEGGGCGQCHGRRYQNGGIGHGGGYHVLLLGCFRGAKCSRSL